MEVPDVEPEEPEEELRSFELVLLFPFAGRTTDLFVHDAAKRVATISVQNNIPGRNAKAVGAILK